MNKILTAFFFNLPTPSSNIIAYYGEPFVSMRYNYFLSRVRSVGLRTCTQIMHTHTFTCCVGTGTLLVLYTLLIYASKMIH